MPEARKHFHSHFAYKIARFITYVSKYKGKQYLGVDLTKCQKIRHSFTIDMKGFDHVLGLVWANAIIPSSCTFFRFQEYSVVIMNPFRFVMAIKNSLLRSICFVMQFSIHQEWLLTATFILYYILVFLKRFLNGSRCFSSSLINVIHYRWNLDLF